TRLTSWVAVSEEPAVDPTQPARRVRIPHALPDGLSLEGLGLRPRARTMGIRMTTRGTGAESPMAVLLAPTRFRATPGSMGTVKKGGSRFLRRAATLRARLVLRKRGDLTFEIDVEAPLDWAPGKSTVRWPDGTMVRADVVEEATTAPGLMTP